MEKLVMLMVMVLLLYYAKNQIEPIISGKSGLIRMGKGHSFAFDLQLFAVVLPENPSTTTATVGKDYKLYVNTGTVEVPVWTIIGGQRNSPLNRTADAIDTSHKTSGGAKSALPGMRGWSIDLDALAMLGDLGIEALDYAYDNNKQVNIKYERPNGTYKTGWGSVTDFSIDPPHDGEATISGTIEGNGDLSAWVPNLTPFSVTVSKAAATDQTFTITPSTTTVSAVKNGGSALTVTTHYTYSAGALVIKGTYLGGLTVGNQSMSVTTGDGATVTFVIVLTA